MTEPDSDVLKIADKVSITANDIDSIQRIKRRRRLLKTSFYLVESLIGITSFLIGNTLIPIKVIESESSYPFGSTILISNLAVFSYSDKRSSILRLIVATLFICIFSFLLGCVTGYIFKVTSVPFDGSAVRYGVYNNN